jgi:hypothetical protein
MRDEGQDKRYKTRINTRIDRKRVKLTPKDWNREQKARIDRRRPTERPTG